MSELTEKLIRVRDEIRSGNGLLLTRADTDALAEAVNLLSDAERFRAALVEIWQAPEDVEQYWLRKFAHYALDPEGEAEANPAQSVSDFVGTLRGVIEAATGGKVSLTNDSKIVPGPRAEQSE